MASKSGPELRTRHRGVSTCLLGKRKDPRLPESLRGALQWGPGRSQDGESAQLCVVAAQCSALSGTQYCAVLGAVRYSVLCGTRCCAVMGAVRCWALRPAGPCTLRPDSLQGSQFSL